MMNHSRAFCLLLTFISTLTSFAQRTDTSAYRSEKFEVAMRDHVKLVTEVLKPKDYKNPLPVIFVRTPYGRKWQARWRAHYTTKGYIVVVQDCRGTGDSEGVFEPYLNERKDGYDALDWISKQAWCNGNIGMIGASYEGQVQLLAAVERHPSLKTIIPQVAGTDPFLDVPYDHGILKLSQIEWAYKMNFPDREFSDYQFEKLYTLPVSKIDDEFFNVNVPLWDMRVERDKPEDWKDAAFLSDLKNVNIPILFVSGNWDVEALSTQINWLAMRDLKKKNQHLLFGPWEHNGFLGEVPTKFSDIEYGEKSKIDFEARWLQWFDHWLKGIDNGIDKKDPVNIFVTGLNNWISLREWPSAAAKKKTYYLSANPGKHFNNLTEVKSKPATVEYSYSPTQVKLNMDPEFSESSVYRIDSTTHDHAVFVSSPLPDEVILGGPSYVDLEFSIDQKDADFFILLAEIDSSGTCRALSHPGKVRAQFRDLKQLTPLVPNKFYKAKIDLFPSVHQFKKGSKLALIVRSDWFPRYVRNLGTGESLMHATQAKEVRIKISGNSKLVLNEYHK